MANYAIIDSSGNVINTIVLGSTSDYTPDDGCTIVQSDTASIGWTYANGVFTPPTAPVLPVSVPDITARQFFISMAQAGFITNAEAVASAQTGAVPASVQSVINALPASDLLNFQITWAKMTMVHRSDPFIAAYASASNLTSDQVDQFFINAATL